MRQAQILLVPLLALAACERGPNLDRVDGRFDREGYQAQAVSDCSDRLRRENSPLSEAERHELCDCIAETVMAASTEAQLRDYGTRHYRRGMMPPEVAQRAQQQCLANPPEPPPAEEPPPSLDGPFPPPPIVQEVPRPGDVPAPNQPGVNAH